MKPTWRDDRFIYKGIWENQLCYCDLDVYDTKLGKVCVVTERDDNPGASVTNCIENIASKLHGKFGDHVLIEHYPRGFRGESYDVVMFSGEYQHPKWRPIEFDKYMNSIALEEQNVG